MAILRPCLRDQSGFASRPLAGDAGAVRAPGRGGKHPAVRCRASAGRYRRSAGAGLVARLSAEGRWRERTSAGQAARDLGVYPESSGSDPAGTGVRLAPGAGARGRLRTGTLQPAGASPRGAPARGAELGHALSGWHLQEGRAFPAAFGQPGRGRAHSPRPCLSGARAHVWADSRRGSGGRPADRLVLLGKAAAPGPELHGAPRARLSAAARHERYRGRGASAGIQDPERAAAFLESYPLFDVLRGLPLSSHHWHAVLTRWLELGLLWWLAGILLLPTSKLYQQGVIILFWL